MKTLVGIANFSTAKSYCADKLGEMLEACVASVSGVHVAVYGDTDLWDGRWSMTPLSCPGSYSEDMLMLARGLMLRDGREGEFDRVVFQGADAFWQSRDDFERLLERGLPIVSSIISARGDVSKAVARVFTSKHGDQDDVRENTLRSGALVAVGFCNADGWVIDRELFGIPFAEGHKPWYKRIDDGEINLCVEENWILRTRAAGYQAWCDTTVKMWHAHDLDGLAKLWPDTEIPIAELSW